MYVYTSCIYVCHPQTKSSVNNKSVKLVPTKWIFLVKNICNYLPHISINCKQNLKIDFNNKYKYSNDKKL